MAPEESRQVSGQEGGAAGGAASSGGQGAAPDVLTTADFDRLLQERAGPMLEQAREQARREMQSRKDREMADRERMYQQRLTDLQGLYSSRVRELGGDQEDVQAVQSAFESTVQEQDRQSELDYYRDQTRRQEEHEATQRYIKNVLSVAGIPEDHPALVYDTEEEFFASVQKAKEQMAAGAPTTPQDRGEQQAAAREPTRGTRGEADVLGGGVGVATPPNPIADITNPDELLKMGFERRRKK